MTDNTFVWDEDGPEEIPLDDACQLNTFNLRTILLTHENTAEWIPSVMFTLFYQNPTFGEGTLKLVLRATEMKKVGALLVEAGEHALEEFDPTKDGKNDSAT